MSVRVTLLLLFLAFCICFCAVYVIPGDFSFWVKALAGFFSGASLVVGAFIVLALFQMAE